MTAHAIKTELLVAESRESLHQTSLELKVPDPELEHGLAAIKEYTIGKLKGEKDEREVSDK